MLLMHLRLDVFDSVLVLNDSIVVLIGSELDLVHVELHLLVLLR